jgi:phosphatidylserine decarboxylase
MRVHKEGYKIIFIVFIVLLLSLMFINYYLPDQTPGHYFIYLFSFFFFVFIVRFFRNPYRRLELDNKIIYAPSDGKVVVIDEVYENEYFKDKRLQISIFMSPINVHKNWYPVSGRVDFYKHHSGRFLVAWHPKSSDLNERTTVVIEKDDGTKILVRQIAGAVAQRISCYAKTAKTVTQGHELGFIKFGSRVDLFLPLEAKILVTKGQKVTGNVTVIGEFAG